MAKFLCFNSLLVLKRFFNTNYFVSHNHPYSLMYGLPFSTCRLRNYLKDDWCSFDQVPVQDIKALCMFVVQPVEDLLNAVQAENVWGTLPRDMIKLLGHLQHRVHITLLYFFHYSLP